MRYYVLSIFLKKVKHVVPASKITKAVLRNTYCQGRYSQPAIAPILGRMYTSVIIIDDLFTPHG